MLAGGYRGYRNPRGIRNCVSFDEFNGKTAYHGDVAADGNAVAPGNARGSGGLTDLMSALMSAEAAPPGGGHPRERREK